MHFYTLKIIAIRRETRDTITLCFKQPSLRKIKYQAGQYLSLVFRINGRRYIRPYSFSSAPGIDEFLEVTIKRIMAGIVSNHIHDQIKIGDSIQVMEPLGDFVYKEEVNIKSVFFWGVGSGITPLISLIKSILFSGNDIRVVLIYGNRNFESTIFSDIIHQLESTHPDRFHVWYFHTQLSVSLSIPNVIEGRINGDRVFEIVKGWDLKYSRHYICGPAGLKESVRSCLDVLNVQANSIFSEDFELIKDPRDFENVHTQQIRLKFNNQLHDLEVIKGKSILEAALDSGLELPYSCQTGKCSTCKGNCRNGDVKMIGLSEERIDLAPKEYLLCCSHPLTADVYIEV